MPELIILGTAASVPDAEHDTVGLVLRGPGWAVLIECCGNSLYKLAQAGIPRDDLSAVILTHRHADHVSGLPMLVQGAWLGGRKVPLPIYGPQETLDVGRQMLRLYDMENQTNMFSLDWRPVPLYEGQHVLTIGGVKITASPTRHLELDCLALRLENESSRVRIVYSSDTEPCPAVIRLASGANLLIHEATGNRAGHSTPVEAAKVAREAGVARLALIHYPIHDHNLDDWLAQASGFPGPVALARDGDVYSL